MCLTNLCLNVPIFVVLQDLVMTLRPYWFSNTFRELCSFTVSTKVNLQSARLHSGDSDGRMSFNLKNIQYHELKWTIFEDIKILKLLFK